MAITTYALLLSSVADYLNRADLTTQIATFATLAEAKFNRKLRVRDMLTRSTATSSNEFVALPSDFLEHYSLELDVTSSTVDRPRLTFINAEEAKAYKSARLSGQVRYYSVIDGAFELLPAPTESQNLKMTYYAKIPALSDSNTSNWLLVRSPDLYLYGCLLEAQPYLKDDDRLATWAGVWQSTIDDMMVESERSMRPTVALQARRRSF